MKALLAEIHRRNRPLSVTGWAHVVMAALFAVGLLVDQRTVLGR